MKYIHLVLASLIFLVSSLTIQAQDDIDEGVVFEIETTFQGDFKDLPQKGMLVLGDGNTLLKTFKTPPKALMAKLKLPRQTKVLDQPVILKHQGTCYQLSCVKGQGCDSCEMLWWDRNNDGKVQPRRELRCVCKAGDPCKIVVKKKACR